MKRRSLRAALPAACCLLLSFSHCGPSGPGSLRPISAPDAESGCPGGRAAWKLEVLDRRAQRRETDKVTALVADSIRTSYPGCAWDRAASDTPTITVELNTFSSVYFGDAGGSWEAEAAWTVAAREASGRILTEFECDEKATRPDYQNSNNEKAVLTRVFEAAMKRLLDGLRTIPAR